MATRDLRCGKWQLEVATKMDSIANFAARVLVSSSLGTS